MYRITYVSMHVRVSVDNLMNLFTLKHISGLRNKPGVISIKYYIIHIINNTYNSTNLIGH